MIKVLHFFKTYYPRSMGGVEQVIYQLSEGTKDFGVRSTVLSLSEQSAQAPQVFPNHTAYTSKLDFQLASTGFSLSVFKRFRALAASADIINYHFPWPFMDVVHFATMVKKPYVVSYHSDIVKQKALLNVYKPLMHAFLSRADRIVASSPNYIETSPVLQQYREKTISIPLGIDPGTYPAVTTDRSEFWRNQFGDRFFLFVGVLRYYKGLKFLLDAAALCGLPIVIAGDGPMDAELKRQVEQLGLTQVHFVGRVSDEDKAALLKLCTALVFPSHLRSEAFGISLIEAAMYGKPMISCEIGTGTTYVNEAGQTGVVVAPESPTELSAAMSWLWNNPDAALTMGNNAKARFELLFTQKKMAKSYSELYHEVLK